MHFTDVVTRRPHCCGQIATTFGKTDGTEPGYNLQITSRPTSLVSNNQLPMLTHEQGWHETINDIYINDIYHDSEGSVKSCLVVSLACASAGPTAPAP